jgi:hypothetical protein
MSDSWYLADVDGPVGPLTLQELRQKLGALSKANDRLVWCEHFSKWMRVGDVTGLIVIPPPMPHPDSAGLWRGHGFVRGVAALYAFLRRDPGLALGLPVICAFFAFVAFASISNENVNHQSSAQQIATPKGGDEAIKMEKEAEADPVTPTSRDLLTAGAPIVGSQKNAAAPDAQLAEGLPCPVSGNATALRGVASQQSVDGRGTVWVLDTDQPFCLTLTPPVAPRHRIVLSSVEIDGQPPPAGVEIELKGKLFSSPLSPDGLEVPVLSVTSGRRVATAPDVESGTTSSRRSVDATVKDRQEPWTHISSLSDYAKHIKHQWLKYADDGKQTSYIDLASIIRSGETLTVLDMQDWNPSMYVATRDEYLGSALSLVRYDCGSAPRSMITAGIAFHGHMGTGTQQEGAADVPKEPPDGWYVMRAGTNNGMLKAREMACNAGKIATAPVKSATAPTAQMPVGHKSDATIAPTLRW